jgi:hypothetical protein
MELHRLKSICTQSANYGNLLSDLADQANEIKDASVYLKKTEEILLKNGIEDVIQVCNEYSKKSDEKARKFRDEGNDRLRNGDLNGALALYNTR